jgi:Tfp pilus assembly protein PilV
MPSLEGSGFAADKAHVRARLRDRLRQDGGFGLIELLIAMLVLNIGLLALVASFNSGIVTLQRASRITTAAVLADQQMELYRAISWANIRLEPTEATNADAEVTPYRSDAGRQYPTALVTGTCSPLVAECMARQTVTGADKRSYRVDTFIISEIPNQGGSNEGRPVKKVTVVVRDGTSLSTVYARQVSTFDQSAG